MRAMFPRVRPGISNPVAFLLLGAFLVGMIYCLGLVIAGLCLLVGLPKSPLWEVLLFGSIGLATLVVSAYRLSKTGYLAVPAPWYYKLPLAFAGYLIVWLGFELYFSGLERLDMVSVVMFAAMMACVMTFVKPRGRAKLAG